MSGTEQKDCTNLADHHIHICQLKKKGLPEEVSARSDNPAYLCHNCNASANRAEDLCNASPLIKR